ncbi:MAG: GldG family protein [Verrucomicrobia bacterium]|nr:GldG family protein [Verrucomicrobiota bacterium]
MANHTSIPRGRIGLNVLLQSALFVLLFAIANYLGFNHYKRWDFSRDQKYTLSAQSKRVLSNLKKPVHLVVFFSGGSPIARDTVNLLHEYAYASKKMVDVEVVDPFLAMSRAREIATQYKLRENDNVVIVDYEGRTQFVSAAEMAEYEPSLNLLDKPRLKTFKGEQAMTSALMEITETGSNHIYSISGHGETALDADPQLSGLKAFIERQNIKIDPLKLTDVELVPPEAKALFIIAPKYDFSDLELVALRAYWAKREKPGRLFVFLEPGTATPNLCAFLAELGIVVNDDRVLRTMPVRLATGVVRGILKEITGDFVPGSPITKRLNNVTARLVGGPTQSLTLDAERGKAAALKLQPLLQASKGFWGETRYAEGMEKGVYFDPKEDHIDPIVAASAEKGAVSDDRLRVDSSRLIVMGSSAFLSNETITEADMDFVLNGLNWLLNREEIIGIAPKAAHNLSLNLTESQLGLIALLVMVAIPGSVGALGFVVWLKRRR